MKVFQFTFLLFKLFTENSPNLCFLRGWIKHQKEINNEWHKFIFYYLCDDTVLFSKSLSNCKILNTYNLYPASFCITYFQNRKNDLRKLKTQHSFPILQNLWHAKKPGYMILQRLISYMYHWSYSQYALKLYISVHLIRIAGLEKKNIHYRVHYFTHEMYEKYFRHENPLIYLCQSFSGL